MGTYLHPQACHLLVVYSCARGGYVAGSATGFDGNDLIRESGEGVVVVVIQYRLGVFGFLPGQKVKNGGALNAGLRGSLSDYIFC